MRILRQIEQSTAHGQWIVCEAHLKNVPPLDDVLVVADAADCECCRFLGLAMPLLRLEVTNGQR